MIIRGGMGGFDTTHGAGAPSTVRVYIPPPPGSPPSTPPTAVDAGTGIGLVQLGQQVQAYKAAETVAIAKQANIETKARTAALDQALNAVAAQRDQAIHIASQLASDQAQSPGLNRALVIGGLVGAAGLVAYLVMRRR